MKKAFIFPVLIFIIFILFGCGDESRPVPVDQKKQVVVQKQQQKIYKETESIEKVKKVWPFDDKFSDDSELDDNPTAKNFILILDGSGSMSETGCSDGRKKIVVAKEAVVEWSKNIPGDANLGLIVFSNNDWSVLPLSHGNRDEFMNMVKNISAGGGTPLSSALGQAYEDFTKQGKKQLGYGEYTIVVVTDGIANDAKRLSEYVNYILTYTPINLYSIGFCIGEKHSLNQPGRTIYKAANNPAQLKQGLSEVLAESSTFDDTEFK